MPTYYSSPAPLNPAEHIACTLSAAGGRLTQASAAVRGQTPEPVSRVQVEVKSHTRKAKVTAPGHFTGGDVFGAIGALASVMAGKPQAPAPVPPKRQPRKSAASVFEATRKAEKHKAEAAKRGGERIKELRLKAETRIADRSRASLLKNDWPNEWHGRTQWGALTTTQDPAVVMTSSPQARQAATAARQLDASHDALDYERLGDNHAIRRRVHGYRARVHLVALPAPPQLPDHPSVGSTHGVLLLTPPPPPPHPPPIPRPQRHDPHRLPHLRLDLLAAARAGGAPASRQQVPTHARRAAGSRQVPAGHLPVVSRNGRLAGARRRLPPAAAAGHRLRALPPHALQHSAARRRAQRHFTLAQDAIGAARRPAPGPLAAQRVHSRPVPPSLYNRARPSSQTPASPRRAGRHRRAGE